MDNSLYSTSNHEPKQPKPKIHFLIGLLVILVAAAITGYLILNNLNKSNPSKELNQPNQSSDQESTKQTKKTEPVHTYVGEIVKISGNSLLIKAPATNNRLEKDTILNVKFDENTYFFGLKFPKKISETEKNKLTRSKIKADDLQLGQKAVVTSLEDISQKTIFLAHRIDIQQ